MLKVHLSQTGVLLHVHPQKVSRFLPCVVRGAELALNSLTELGL